MFQRTPDWDALASQSAAARATRRLDHLSR
jgi:hypothetical protein